MNLVLFMGSQHHRIDEFWLGERISYPKLLICTKLKKKKTKKKPQDSIIPPHPKKTHQNNMPVDQKSVIKATVWKNKQQI